jgi:predicted neuraminidase
MRTSEASIGCENLIAMSRSDDFGVSWSKVMPTVDKIPNPDSGLDVVTLKNGHVLLICNPTTEHRHQLTVFLSEDDGETFPIRKDLEIIESGKEYHYPAIIQSADGLIHVVYTNQRLNIKHACFNEEWIKSED